MPISKCSVMSLSVYLGSGISVQCTVAFVLVSDLVLPLGVESLKMGLTNRQFNEKWTDKFAR